MSNDKPMSLIRLDKLWSVRQAKPTKLSAVSLPEKPGLIKWEARMVTPYDVAFCC